MATIGDARSAVVDAIRAADLSEANLSGYPLPEGSTIELPRISVEINTIRYYQTIGRCSKAEMEGVIRIEVGTATAEDASNGLDEYLDPYSEKSIVSALMAAAAPGGTLAAAVDSFITTDANYVAINAAEVPFRMTTTRPAAT